MKAVLVSPCSWFTLECGHDHMGGFIDGGTPIAGWFRMEHPVKTDDSGVPPFLSFSENFHTCKDIKVARDLYPRLISYKDGLAEGWHRTCSTHKFRPWFIGLAFGEGQTLHVNTHVVLKCLEGCLAYIGIPNMAILIH